jgi:hypothetical protein
MKIENPIHIKLSHSEAVNLKKDMLGTQMSSIRIARTIQKFNDLRQEELRIKTSLQKKIKEFKHDLKEMEHLLPKPNIPKILKKDEEKGIEKKLCPIASARGTPEGEKSANLEEQLQEIQNRLNSLE